jgi:tetratricopeptide (TPR) repeat protein/predicted Ser/Thr protein kinase
VQLTHDTIPSPPREEIGAILERGAVVGRYVVIGLEARGGMGVVYEAHDPELNRKVALKLLRPDRVAADARREYEERLRREAQSLAQLLHPNVVAAYDVGTVGGQIFVAMEYVDGQTLDRWCRAARRPWRQILAHYLDAGRGLGAAHAAGLIHRDFKPENVLLGADGRVRVVDFGLARLASSREGTSESDRLAMALTGEGLRMGTPTYMSPEQYRGEELDAASDQFSFCVALYYGLYGTLPFAAKTWEELAVARAKGIVQPPPRGTKVPRSVHRAIVRGLSVAREDRFPSMQALIEALLQDPLRTPKRAAWWASSFAVALGAAFSIQHFTDAARLCRGSERNLAGVWDAERRQAIEAGLAGTGAPYAAATIREVVRAFDELSLRWVVMHRDACEATRVRGDQTEEILGLRMACLDAGLREMKALGDRFVEADREVAANAIRAVQNLPDVADCADLRALGLPVRPPSDPDALARVDRIRDGLAEVRSFEQTGRYREGLEAARALAREARAVAYRPLEAESLHLLGIFADEMGDLEAAEQSLEQAVWAAEAGRHDRLATRAWIRLIRVVGDRRGRYDEARELAPRVTAALERIGGDAELEASLSYALAIVAIDQGRYGEGEVELQRALSLLEKRFGSGDLRLVEPLRKLAFIAAHRDQSDVALVHLRRALTIQQRYYDEHPEIAATLETIANAEYVAARYTEAEAGFLRALEMREKVFGKEHISIANTLHSLAAVYMFQARPHDAVRNIRQAIAMDEKLLGPKHPQTLRHLEGLSIALQNDQKPEEALEILDRLLPQLIELHGDVHPTIADVLHTIALIDLDLGRPEQALEAAAKSQEMNVRMLGPEFNSSSLLRVMGRAHLMLGQPAQAVAPLSQARTMHLAKKDDPGELAWTTSLLGQALFDSRKDVTRGKSLVREAQRYMRKDSRLEAELAELERWIRLRRAALSDA